MLIVVNLFTRRLLVFVRKNFIIPGLWVSGHTNRNYFKDLNGYHSRHKEVLQNMPDKKLNK